MYRVDEGPTKDEYDVYNKGVKVRVQGLRQPPHNILFIFICILNAYSITFRA